MIIYGSILEEIGEKDPGKIYLGKIKSSTTQVERCLSIRLSEAYNHSNCWTN